MKLFDKQSLALLISVVMINVICIITVSYAYFTTQIKGNESSTPIEVVMGTMKIKYEDSNLVTLNDALPGDYLINKFKITNIGTLDAVYNLKIDVVENNFRDKGDLEYILRRNDEGVVDSGTLPYTDGYILTNITIPSEEIHNYELEVRFKKDEIDKDQNDNKNRKLEFKIEADTKENVEKYVYEPLYKDNSGANAPELYQGLIPIYYNESNQIVIADVTKEWYDYDKHNWANAVLIDHTKPEIVEKFYKEDGTLRDGEIVTTDDILQMYVWIPRYKYQLFNANNGSVDPQMINIEFEKNDYTTGTVKCEVASNGVETCENDINGNWYTHPAFTFGDTELNGIWVGKFEPSDKNSINTTPNLNSGTTISEITILPNKVSITQKSLKTMFDATRSIENNKQYVLNEKEIDTHIMKNMEWGATAYLSQSQYGIFNKIDGKISCSIDSNLPENECRIWNNDIWHGDYGTPPDGTVTGCSGDIIDAAGNFGKSYCLENHTWEKMPKASTTGNVYGIYDMSGGMWEYTMGNMTDEQGRFYPSDSELKENEIDKKYYDLYIYGTEMTTHIRGHLGDATRETLQKFGVLEGGWNNDTAYLPYLNYSWFMRGGEGNNGIIAGIFAFDRRSGLYSEWYTSFRVVLTAQDGNL